jgi:2-hydroxy-3-keto-5-methylthiopentenyl-1-phosphate phosphatase
MMPIGVIFVFLAVVLFADNLPSWNQGNAKTELIEFIQVVTTPESHSFLSPNDRIAVFDMDGTLWVEQPLYTFALFAFDVTASFDRYARSFFEDVSIEQYQKTVMNWLQRAVHPRFRLPFTQLLYQPMLELIDLLKAHEFKVYIVSGGGQEFIRTFSTSLLGIPSEQVIGSMIQLEYALDRGSPTLFLQKELISLNEQGEKVANIHRIIGKRPVFACGNSTGDEQMLEWTQHNTCKTLQLLIHHDDPIREYAYDQFSLVGTFSSSLRKKAESRGWIIVSMRNDWNTIFR